MKKCKRVLLGYLGANRVCRKAASSKTHLDGVVVVVVVVDVVVVVVVCCCLL